MIGPEHAEVIAGDGFTKADVKRFLAKHAVVPPTFGYSTEAVTHRIE